MMKIPVGISSCLMGEAVRYDGAHKRDAYIMGTLSEYFEFKPFCPEVEIGLGVPRPSIRLLKLDGEIVCRGAKDPSLDVTDRLRERANQLNAVHAELCGYIFKKDSPSCGVSHVRVFHGDVPRREGSGIYAKQVMLNHPCLPMEEEGRLGDPGLRENFIQRVYIYYRWRSMVAEGLSVTKLMNFHARHKLIIMSHADYAPLGQLLAQVTTENLQATADHYLRQLMQILKKVASRKNHVNVLQHIQGYLKNAISADDKAELCEVIERYRHGELPLIVPLTLLKHHFRKAPDPYIEQSFYMSPYPQELRLINQL